ncbi:uncharacterized protein C8A04DRAFT_11741 [Dichotomopilus funicola]|uniref:Uncharacterized protein n=1 Tax=Dichotomopilus funicola TaxID=1934379 RepID=A0AAN6V3S6_9PEZI|nr:hypothetical protein C8A04DRAFT_11741 [Dichotomopilus funicola]
MPTGSDFRVSLPNMGTSHANFALGLDADALGSHSRMFKKHKVLPHPRKEELQRSGPWRYGRGSERSLLQNGSLPTSSPYTRPPGSRTGTGPEPPPTPPAHSRTSSVNHAGDSSSASGANNPLSSTGTVEPLPPVTPPHQQTPPTPNLTPDRTPPGPAATQAQRRPPLAERNSSKVTNGSRVDSFTTAREDPYSSDDDDRRPTLRPSLPSAKTSQSTVRQVSKAARSVSQPVGLGLGLESNSSRGSTPKTVPGLGEFDGEYTTRRPRTSDAEGVWDPQLMKNVTVRKIRRPVLKPEIIDDRAITPTNATRALRSMSLEESPIVYPSRRVASDRYPTRPGPTNLESPISTELKRSSVVSTKSNASTIVSAVLVGSTPQRQKTLRHIRKHSLLRDSSSEASPPPTSASTAAANGFQPTELPAPQANEAVREVTREPIRDSYVSTATNNSISSRKARRSVWNSGAVPVVVIPERRSSVKSNSKSPSLRSTSSRRSRSVSSVPTSQPSKSKEQGPIFERPGRRSRAYSESDGSRPGDERTMDFPPVIPTRSSSLSAPTSRNASRAGSLTAESLNAHNIFHAQQAHRALQNASQALEKANGQAQPVQTDRAQHRNEGDHLPENGLVERKQPVTPMQRTLRDKQGEFGGSPALTFRDSRGTSREHSSLGVDRDEDPFFGKRLSVQNTPLSVASADTAATSHAEVSEAMAVNIYPHQSKSVVLVDHSAKPSESSSPEQEKPTAANIPIVRATDVDGSVPTTPPQRFAVEEVDSPLRNPRAPPQPPIINFIPATPSGLTPSTERQVQLGNYYEMTREKPKRSLSLLRQALTRRKSDYGPSPGRPVGLLTRTFSLSRNIRRFEDRPRLKRRSTADSVSMDETRLHPHWRPAYAEDEPCDCDECRDGDDYYDDEYDDDRDDDNRRSEDDRTYRYPPIDNRPYLPSPAFAPPRRRLSERIKRTFAIIPTRDSGRGGDGYDDGYDSYYSATSEEGPDRRTIRRTPSGNLRVMKFRRSVESLTRGVPENNVRPYTSTTRPSKYFPPRAGAGRGYTTLWRSLSARARSSIRRRASQSGGNAPGERAGGEATGFLPTLGDRMNFPRRLSERRREKRTQELRGMISGPREVRDGVGEVIRRNTWKDRDALYVAQQQQERREQGLERQL